jgi:hypothetical protein
MLRASPFLCSYAALRMNVAFTVHCNRSFCRGDCPSMGTRYSWASVDACATTRCHHRNRYHTIEIRARNGRRMGCCGPYARTARDSTIERSSSQTGAVKLRSSHLQSAGPNLMYVSLCVYAMYLTHVVWFGCVFSHLSVSTAFGCAILISCYVASFRTCQRSLPRHSDQIDARPTAQVQSLISIVH